MPDKLPQTLEAAGKLAGEERIPLPSGGSRSLRDYMDFGQLMAKAGPAIPTALRSNPGACVAVTMQADRWGLDPFAVARQAYITKDRAGNETLAYMAQLVAAVVNLRGPFIERPRIEFSGEGTELRAEVSATIRGETKPRTLKTPKVKDIGVKNSPLWTSDPEQQLSYYALRAFGRRHCPEVILGVYTPDEIDMMEPIGSSSTAEPRARSFRDTRGTPGDGLEVVDEEANSDEAQAEADRMVMREQRGETGADDLGAAQAGEHEDQGTDTSEPEPPVSDAENASQDEPDAEIDKAVEAEKAAIADAEAMVQRMIDDLPSHKTVADLRTFADHGKINIGAADGVPAGERGRLRGEFQAAVLKAEQALTKPKGRGKA